MKDIVAIRLQPRIAKLATEDVIEIVDKIAGLGTYVAIIRQMDEELARRRVLRRKGPIGDIDPVEIRLRQQRLVEEAEETRRFNATKRGKLESHFLHVVHNLRTSEKPLSFPSCCRFLQSQYRFKVSVIYLQRSYSAWLLRVNAKKAEMLPGQQEVAP